ncbi:MAG: UDP-glucose dehydrogenase family protein [Inhella sp.]|jgi:UDPglucose 6-dehydrogenase|uniref:UDP-glucose dehydrogenase family protein n=1 Tax=Inhella sp. TaxID=1921806 RepID=UPI0022C58B6D|nr:UDP-glucose/GDP-mannose dehydrogenase family protein [Inhella sp.]MCZ8233832.1 UDP-glucose/GDP-mannose dehydrogenase family protein [Inhella sp.]
MKITVIGAGYVGLVTAACLADMGNSVVGLDVDEARVASLGQGILPIHEPGLDGLVVRNQQAGRLRFTTDAGDAIAHGSIVFIAVGTPPAEDGSADLAHVLSAAATVGRHMNDYKVVVNKSTVPVGTAEKVRATLAGELQARAAVLPFSVVSNPEFLKEGAAVDDFMSPDRVIVGADDDRALYLLRSLYAPFLRNRDRLLTMDPRSAELTKYAANAMLAMRISFMNEMALLADAVGADVEQVRQGIGSDPRIGTHFLYAGCGWGGSCFPKDVKALAHLGHAQGVGSRLLDATLAVNDRQRELLAARVVQRFGPDLRGRRFAVWGLAFKPGTDDVREAPSRVLIAELLERGAEVAAYDPVAMASAARHWPDLTALNYAPDPYAAALGADALLVVTEWREFRSPDFERLRGEMATPIVYDGRNLYDPTTVRALGFEHVGIGRGTLVVPGVAQPEPERLRA